MEPVGYQEARLRRRRRVRGAAAVAVVALIGGATVRSVHADDLVPVQLEYTARALAGCPDTEAFTREVLARAPRARLAAPSEHARTLAAQVRTTGARGYEGVLAVRDPSGPTTERAVHAPSCTEVVTALAVIAAMVVDPVTAKIGAIDAGASSAEAAADAATDASQSTSPPADDGSAPPIESAVPTALPPPLPPPGPAKDRWDVSAGAGGAAIGGSAPTLLFSVPVFFEVARQTGGTLEPALRFRFERTVTASSEEGEFSRTGGSVDLCPIALRARSLRAQPCARIELAALYAKGRAVDPVRSDLRPWFAFGPLARVRLELAAPIFLELEGGVLIAGVRDRFFVEPGTLVYRAPVVGATTAFALGLAF
jgi:hypothetical protein